MHRAEIGLGEIQPPVFSGLFVGPSLREDGVANFPPASVRFLK